MTIRDYIERLGIKMVNKLLEMKANGNILEVGLSKLGRAKLGMGLPRKKYRELVDMLRKTFLYQDVVSLYEDGQNPETESPKFVGARIPVTSYLRIMQLIQEHGGWTLPPEQREAILERTKQKDQTGESDADTES